MNKYYELKLKINPKIEEIISDLIFETLQCEGVVMEEQTYKDEIMIDTTQGTLKAYLKSTENINKTLNEQKESLLSRGLSENEIGSWEYEINEVQNQDWSKKWKENWGITKITDKITVIPSWIEHEGAPDEITISLDPGSAFGTGTHPTTQLCMRAIEKHLKINDKMADIGTGSGILAICALKAGAKSAYGCDNDELVINTAKENSKKNNVSDNCIFEHKTADEISDKFDFITANILHNILAEIMKDLKKLMNNDAKLVLSGIMNDKKQVVLDSIKTNNMKIIEEIEQEDWIAYVVKAGENE